MNKHLNRIIPALISALSGSDHPDFESAESVILSVQKEPGPAFLIEELVKCCRDTLPEVRATAMRLLHVLSSKSSADLTEHVPQLMIFTTESLNDPSDEVCEAAWLALEAVVKVSIEVTLTLHSLKTRESGIFFFFSLMQRVNQKELPHFTGYLRKGLRTVSSQLGPRGELRGFSLKVSSYYGHMTIM